MITYLLIKKYLGDPNVPKWIRCLIGCIPSIGMIALGAWSYFSGKSDDEKAIGVFLALMFLLFGIFVCLKISADDENKNDTGSQDK